MAAGGTLQRILFRLGVSPEHPQANSGLEGGTLAESRGTTMDFTTDNIEGLRVEPGGLPAGGQVSFRSSNVGMCHQLYVNGRLAQWTEAAEGRSFRLPPDARPRQVVVAAVAPALKAVDFSCRLPQEVRQPPWVYRPLVVRDPRYGRGCRMALLGDHASGRKDDRPLAVTEVWPEWAPRWAWGEGFFGRGGFGLDAVQAPGFGAGCFGGGLFGADEAALDLVASLAEEGVHHLALRLLGSDGAIVDGPDAAFLAHPPPAPPRSVTAVAYDNLNQILTLQIER